MHTSLCGTHSIAHGPTPQCKAYVSSSDPCWSAHCCQCADCWDVKTGTQFLQRSLNPRYETWDQRFLTSYFIFRCINLKKVWAAILSHIFALSFFSLIVPIRKLASRVILTNLASRNYGYVILRFNWHPCEKNECHVQSRLRFNSYMNLVWVQVPPPYTFAKLLNNFPFLIVVSCPLGPQRAGGA